MRLLFTLILIIFVSGSSNAQTNSTGDVEPYDYDTTLKVGYTISFKVDDSLQYLYLKKRSKTIIELASTSRGLLYKNLGYVGTDFKDYFVLVHSFGSGNPNYIELIKKSTGRNALKEGAAWIDVDKKKEFILYSDNDVPNSKNKMTLYNTRTRQKQFFSYPSDIFNEPQILNRIQISRLTDKQFVIKYDTKKVSKRRFTAANMGIAASAA